MFPSRKIINPRVLQKAEPEARIKVQFLKEHDPWERERGLRQ